LTIHDRRKDQLRARARKVFGQSDLHDVEAEYDPTLNYGENVENVGLGGQRQPTRKEIKATEKQAYESNMSSAIGHTFNNDPGPFVEVKAMPRIIKRKGMDIHIDAPILSDAEAIKTAISIGLARVAEAIKLDVVSNLGGEFGDNKPDGFMQGDNSGKYPGTYPNAAAYYSNNKIPFWRGGLRGSFVVGVARPYEQELQFDAPYAITIENGGAKSGELDGAWVQDKLDAYWQTTHSGWSGGIDLHKINAHPFTAGVAENINLNMLNFGYLDIFATHFTASIKG
jgi:hypothetical protein